MNFCQNPGYNEIPVTTNVGRNKKREEVTMAIRRVGLIACTLFLLATVSADGQEPAARFEKVVKRMAQAINAGNCSAAQEDFSKRMLGAIPLEKWKPLSAGAVIRKK